MRIISLDAASVDQGVECFKYFEHYMITRERIPTLTGMDMIPGAAFSASDRFEGEALLTAVARATRSSKAAVRRILERLGGENPASWPCNKLFVPIDYEQELLLSGHPAIVDASADVPRRSRRRG